MLDHVSADPNYAVIVEGLDDLNFSDISPKVERAAYQAINAAAKFTRTENAELMRRKYNFPGNYLDPSKKRFYVSKQAQSGNLEAVVTANTRATSLARFIVNDGTKTRSGIVIKMKQGKTTTLKHAFTLMLKAGTDPDAPRSNLALAIKTKGGAKPDKAYKAKRLGNSNVWLLYGISVDQAFNYSRKLTENRALLYLESEFTRLIAKDDL